MDGFIARDSVSCLAGLTEWSNQSKYCAGAANVYNYLRQTIYGKFLHSAIDHEDWKANHFDEPEDPEWKMNSAGVLLLFLFLLEWLQLQVFPALRIFSHKGFFPRCRFFP